MLFTLHLVDLLNEIWSEMSWLSKGKRKDDGQEVVGDGVVQEGMLWHATCRSATPNNDVYLLALYFYRDQALKPFRSWPLQSTVLAKPPRPAPDFTFPLDEVEKRRPGSAANHH